MKKFAFGILSVFMILGGVLLSACSNEVSLSVSSQDVVIYTNDDQKENFKQKEIEVTLENSTAGIGVEVSSGAKCIDIEKTNTTTPKANGKYAFKILTKDDDTSGKAEVKVYAIEDKSKEKVVNVSVMTVLEGLVSVNDDSVDARSNMFVVKGQGKTLVAENYFDFNPISANVKDIDWTFEDSNSKELKIDGNVVATITENKLNVLTNFTLNKISLVASFKDNSKVSNTVTFDVLNDSTIKNFTLDGEGIIENNVVRISGQNVKLKRNNSAEAVAQGSIEINTTYDIDFSVDAYQILADGTKYYLSEEDVANNFNFDIVEEKTLATSHTYKFNLDAYDYFNNGLYGKYYLVFNVNYKDYNYSITTKDITLSIETSYAATRVDLYDGENRSIDSSVALNVFSSYNAGQGFEVKAVVQPENRKIDNNMFRFVVDTNQAALASESLDPTNPISDVFKIFYKGKLLTFKKEGSLYVSSELTSGDESYITAVDTYRNVEVDVQSLSNTDVYSRLILNLFKISDDESLSITNADDSEIEKNVYISSSLTSSKVMNFEYKIKGISSESGLSLNTVASDKFEFSNYEVVSASDTNDEKYIVVRFSVKLLTSKFEEKAKFTFVHLTGKTSETVTIQAFVPIETAYIQNMDTASADVFHQESATMGYELTEDGVVASAFANNSLSKLVLEASTTIKLKTEISNATLAEDKIKFKYLSYEDVQEVVESYGLGIDVEEIFDNADFDIISMAYNYFESASEFSTFAITSDKLIVNDATFKGVVAVEVYGYNEDHEQTVFVRFFTIESVYSVRYLSPNVKTKLLYTTETLSQKDMNLSYVDVVLSLRPDSKVPSYSNDLRRLSFASAGLELEKVSDTYYKNQYYTITDVGFVENGRKITFRVTANSTNLLTVFNDVISVTYKDINHIKDDVISTEISGKERKAEISIEIRNVKRIENVEWMNKPLDGKIYLNLTAATNSEKEFTISTSVLPADANDIKLTYKYFATSGAASDLNVNTSEVGQTVNVNINTSIGGTGFLYLLPSDMIKNVEGTDSLLLYKYTEVDGKIVETPYYDIKLNDLSNFYKKIVEGVDDEGNEIAEFDNYFYNNDGEKIFYKDIILKIEVVIADGRSQETRIRLYNQGDLENMDSSLFYEVMNDITFYGWKSKTEFKGSIDGNGHTFKFVKWDESDAENRKNQTFVNVLSKTQTEGSGTLLNINFTGFVYSQSNTYAGFIANQVAQGAQIINCTIDVYSEANNYMPSELRSISSNYTGGVVGQNNGTLSNVKVYGLSMKGLSGDLISAKIGGIAGCNAGLIENCGYELYNFGDEAKTTIANTNGDFGGLIGYADSSSRAIKSYVYDFGGNYNAEKTIGFAYTVNIASKVVSFEECFAYLGNVNTVFDNSNSVLMKNSYITFKQDDEYVTKYYDQNGNEISSFDGVTVDETIWFVEGSSGFDENVNFAHSYLRNVLPSATVDLEELNVADVDGKCSSANGDGTVKKGVLYIYNPVQTITNVAEKSELDSYNTISVATLFGVTEYQARSLLLTSTSTNVLISANQIKVVNSTFAEFEIVAHLKTNFSQTVSFKFVVLNVIPKITTTLNGLTVNENQTLMLQNGKTKNIVYNFDSKVALNGNLYALRKDSYNIEYSLADEYKQYVNISKTGNVLVLTGKEKKDENISIKTNVVVVGLDGNYKTATLTQKNFNVCVFNGTTALSVSNADGIVVKASKYANFEVYMNSDDYKIDGSEKKLLDNLYLTLKNGEIEVEGRKVEENKIVFDIDEKLSLEAFWSYKNIDENLFKFDVVIKICDENRHLIDENYEDLKLFVNAESQKENTEYVKQIDFVVETQEVESTSIAFYEIAMRQYKNSKLHYIKSSNTLTTVSPSSDLILAVTISPAYAKADSFNLTYTMSGSGSYGTINIAKLDSDINGFYISQNYNIIENGVNVILSEEEKKGDGVFYFRVYISSLFSGEIDLKFNLEVFGQTNVKSSKSLTVSALKEASVKVDGSTRTVLAKGEEAKVEITVGVDQAIYNLYLENCGQNISLVFDKNQEPVYDGANKIYTASLYAGFDSKLSNGSESGVFYVCATVERTINGVQEFKTTTATVYLVDFAIDLDETKVSNTRKTAVYNGKTYDVLTSYLNDSQILNFDYTLLPQNYTYDMTNEAEIEAVEGIEEKKNQFKNQNYYSDADSGYYINYVYNTNRGTYEVVKLRNQLWYATSESYVTNVYNETAQRFNGGNGYFALEETANGNIIITGKRTGLQLMMLRTTVICQGEEFVYDYFFLVQVEVYTDEDSPKTIRSAEEFLKVTEESDAADYILMNDIVLDNYTPIDSDKFRSLDGNGYTIHLNSFALPSDSSELNLALFNNVAYTSTLKNLKVNIYNGGQIAVDVNTYKTINIAGFAISNKGIIYNCDVVSYYDSNYQTSRLSGKTGIVVSYTNGAGTDAIEITSLMGVESNVAGFVVDNEEGSTDDVSSISNCRVGGLETYHALIEGDVTFRQTIQLPTFYIVGQGTVSGFAVKNDGVVSASYAKNVQIENQMQSTASITAGFVVENNLNVKNSFVEGLGGSVDVETLDPLPYNDKTSIKSMGVVAGFVYENTGNVLNSYSNIKIEKSYLSAGFVFRNTNSGNISLCYTASLVDEENVGQMKFCGVNAYAVSQNEGKISLSYFYKKSRLSDSEIGSGEPSGVYGVNEVFDVSTFYGFSFNSSEGSYDGIWEMRYEGLTLVSANTVAFSNRYAKIVGEVETVFYNKNVRDYETYEVVDVSYGSVNNPIIIRNAEDFAKATGKATTTEISSYKEYYTDTEVLGAYRIVKDIDMTDVAQNADETNAIRLRTTTKTFKGIFDGNGFTIANISLGSSIATENYGLFAKISEAVIMNIDFTVESVHNTEANIVGALAGTAYNTRILSVSLSPASNQQTESANTAVQGNNIVGGVVGIVLGDSYICNVQVENMDVESAFYDKNKKIDTNYKNYTQNLRSAFNATNSIRSIVANLSYAGAVAGYVDIYYGETDDYAKFSENLTVNDYNVLSVDVSGTVNIYGEVVGGIFGYIGSSTYIYDIDLELNSQPSHIISKNLFAGGIVGESYGGMYAVSSHFDSQTQLSIERNENNYYNGSYANKGQETIFSYAQNEEGSFEKINAPLFIGGVAGYMGGGYVYVGYSKLNVISTSEKTVAAGGIVGLLGKTSNYYSLDFVSIAVSTNYLFRDVYASGDVYTTNGCAGGIIGSVQKESGIACDIALKNVMALNLFTNNETKLAVSATDDVKYSTNTFTLIGKVCVEVDAGYALENAADRYNGNIYLINNESSVQYNAGTGETKSETGSPTVGGYSSISNKTATIANLDAFGFLTRSANNNARLLLTNPIGGAEFSTGSFESYSYARNYSYFIGNGWAEKFWRHEQDTLLPYIELTPRLDVLFWDVYNTAKVLQEMNNSSLTVVIRGRISPSINDIHCSDIDLTSESVQSLIGDGLKFRGKLYSYEKYMNTSEGGQIDVEAIAGVGGKTGETAGLIINKTLFDNIYASALIDGVKFYVNTAEDVNAADGFTGVVNTIEDSVVRNVRIYYRQKAKLSAEEKGSSLNKKAAAGVLAQTAISTNIMNCEIVFKENEEIVFVANETATNEESYYGLIVGYFEQKSKFTNISLQNNLIKNAKNVTLIGDGTDDNGQVYFGLYAGYATKQASNAKIEVVMLELLSDVNITLSKIKAVNAYVGGYVGKAENISSLTFQKREGGSGSCEFTFEYTNSVIGNLSQGALVGEISGGTYSITGSQMKIVSKNTSTDNIASANIGGLVGSFDGSSVTITSFVVETKVGDKDNSMKFKNVSAVGGLVGNVNGGKCTVSNCSSIGGDIYVNSSTDIYAGGLVGNVTANAQMEVSGQIINETNLNVVSTTIVYVGGAVGNVNGEIVNCQNGFATLYKYYGDINISANTVYVGGFAGKVFVSDSTISNVVCGGEINCNNANENTSIYVGGVVGKIESSNESEISNCFAFSDVYVNYAENDTNRLSVYDFGGIAGSAKNVKIMNCKSLTSNFNTRNITINDSKIIYNCGAICGIDAGDASVSYENNMYCSGVNLEYQKENGNKDCAYLYGTSNTYYGYSNSAKTTVDSASTTEENKVTSSSEGILSFVSTYVEQGNKFRALGEKLNPIQLGENDHSITTSKWHTLTQNIEINSVLTETLSSKTRFVGNGFVITRSSGASQVVSGGLFNTISGGSVSNVVINANMTEDSADISFGGVAGELSGNGIIYAVGVNGLVSVNGANNLGGLVGSAKGGLISNCYFDGDLEYRGLEETGGILEKIVSGLVGIVSENFNTVLSSYSSGMIVTYVDCTATRFTSVANNPGTAVAVDFVDCYSIIQLDNDSNVEETDVSLKNFGDNSIVDINETKTDVTPLSYSGYSISRQTMSANDNTTSARFTWYFDKFVNYGYAAHGFGFLRDAEIKVFDLSDKIEFYDDSNKTMKSYVVDGTSGDNAEYYRYSYEKVALSDLSKENEYYFEIPNFAKFEQIEDSNNSKKFILRYDIDLKSTTKSTLSVLDGFVLDGQGHNLKNYTKNYALFDTIVNAAIIRNVNMTNATIDPRNGDVGVLANVNNGKIYNVYVEGNITSNIANANVGGVVGVNGGKIFLAEACVNITNKVNAISGGIAGQNTGTISYASSNGMIVNEATSGSVGETCDIEKYDGTISSNVSATSIQGGIVGYMTAGEISSSYNTNSVLGNYTNTTSSSSKIVTVSGGIVGYITSGTIDNCVNAGLVGAGNYNNSESYSYAGGIVGYAASNIRVDVTNCVNDGPVQALGKVVSDNNKVASSQSQTIVKKSGNENESLKNDPTTLKFEVTNKFNVGSNRQIYAFGIGFGLGNTSSNITSSDNIKNDGVIGEIEQIGDIEFDREKILSNNSSDSFYGTFALQESYSEGVGYGRNVSGYDSYGFVTRLYMIDQITRQYKTESTNEVALYAKNVHINTSYVLFKQAYSSGLFKYNGTSYSDSLEHAIDPDNLTNFLKKNLLKDSFGNLLGVGAPVKYSASAEFNGYEYYLNDANEKSLNGCGSEDSETASANKINEITQKFENHDEMRTISVKDENIAVVNNYTQLKTSLGPVEVTVSQEFTFPANARDISFSIKHNGSEDWVSKTLRVTENGNTKTATFVLYYSDSNGKYSGYTISASYKIDAVTQTITKNNVTVSGDNVVITLDISQEVCEALEASESDNKKQINEEKYNSYTTSINGTNVTGTLDWDDSDSENPKATFTLGKTAFESALGTVPADGDIDFVIVANITTEKYKKADVWYRSEKTNTTIDFSDLCSVTDTKGYVEVVNMSSLAGYYNPSTRTINIAGLTAALGNSDKQPNKIVFYYKAADGNVARTAVGNKNGSTYVWTNLSYISVDTNGNLVEASDKYAGNFTSWEIAHSNTEFTAKSIGSEYNSTVNYESYSITFNGIIASKYLSGTGTYDTFKGVQGMQFERYKYKYTLKNSDEDIITVKFNGNRASDTNTYGYTMSYSYTDDEDVVHNCTSQGIMKAGNIFLTSKNWIGNASISHVLTSTTPASSENVVIKSSTLPSFNVYTLSTDEDKNINKIYYKKIDSGDNVVFEKVSATTGNPSREKWYEISNIVSLETGSEDVGVDGVGAQGYTKTTISKNVVAENESAPSDSFTLYNNGYRKIERKFENDDEKRVYLTNADATKIWEYIYNDTGNDGSWREYTGDKNYDSLFKFSAIAKLDSNDNYIFIKNDYTYLIDNSGIEATKDPSNKTIKTPIYYANSETYTVTSDYVDVKKDSVSITKVLIKSEDEEIVSGKTYYSVSGTTYEIVTETTGKNPSQQGWYEDAGVSAQNYVEYNSENGVFTAKQKDSCVYAYVADCKKVSKNISVPQPADEEQITDPISYVVLNSQIYGSTIRIISGVKLIGREHLYKVPSNIDADGNKLETIFSSNAGTIKNLTAAGAISGRQLTGDTSFLIEENSGTVSNVNAYGSLRNVKSEGITIKPVLTNDEEIIPTPVVSDVKSSITVTVLDAVDETSIANPNGASVTTSIVENFETNNILISGDGVNGRNGTDGPNGIDGTNGGNAGKGGNITTESESATKFVRSGADGKNGYGGNGGNGYFKERGKSISKAERIRFELMGLPYEGTSSAQIITRGNGGEAGTSSDLADGTNCRTVNTKTYSGNSGIDGFGRIDEEKNVYYYLDDGETRYNTWCLKENGSDGYGDMYLICGMVGNPNKWVITASTKYLRVEYGFMWAPYSNYESSTIKSDIESAYKESGAKGMVYYQKQERRNCWNYYEGQDSLIFGDYSAINKVDSFTRASLQ